MILDKIELPQGIGGLSAPEKQKLAEDIRNLLISRVAEFGGHLAANLGVVELSIALHSVFNTETDRLIWDVGHQSYVHKILTGRYEQMSTLRQKGGLSGFPKSAESIHDAFDTGHSSTSISAAVGLALGRDIRKESHSIVAVIGDGALTGGMAFEALNHAGHKAVDILVVLNDNEMSISKNVGALSAYLNRIRTDPSYNRTKFEIESALQKIPGIGTDLAEKANWLKDKVKYLMVPGVLFEELGFTYIGPIDGHDLQQLTRVLTNARSMKGPVLIHAITQKGKGYAPAQNHPDLFHGVGPFDITTGEVSAGNVKTYTEVFGEFMVRQAAFDPKIVAITAAMASGTGLTEFSRQFPERFFDVGICEQHAVTMAAGLAKAGLRPVVAIYSTFLQRAFDQMIHDVALQNLPVVFAADRSGLVGEDGPTHHGAFDLAYARIIPNFTVMAPSDEKELTDMLYTALLTEGPVFVRYPRGAGEGIAISDERERLAVGKARILQEGKDLAIVAIGQGVKLGRETVNILAQKGVKTTLVDARFVKPLDIDLFRNLAKQHEMIVIIEEGCLAGGFGGAVLEELADALTNTKVLRFGIPDIFVEHGKTEQLLQMIGLDPQNIAEQVTRRLAVLDIRKHKRALELLKVGENKT